MRNINIMSKNRTNDIISDDDEKAILKFISIYPEFTLQEFYKHQKSYRGMDAISRIMNPEKDLKRLVEKGMAEIKMKNGEEVYTFLYGIREIDGKEELYDKRKADWDAMRLRDICP